MKKMKIALSLVLLPIFMYADGEFAMEDTRAMTATTEAQTPFIEYNNRMVVFDPLHQAYERIKPNAFYVGVEGWVVGAVSSKWDTAIAEGELRLGYNLFYNGRDHVTPFVGGGVFVDCNTRHETKWDLDWVGNHRRHKHHKSVPAVAYGVLGFLFDHEFNSVVNLGANLKGILGGGVSKKHFDWGNPVVGFDVAIPLTFRFGHKRHWDFRIEPFDIFLHGKNVNVNYFGGRSTLGYRF